MYHTGNNDTKFVTASRTASEIIAKIPGCRSSQAQHYTWTLKQVSLRSRAKTRQGERSTSIYDTSSLRPGKEEAAAVALLRAIRNACGHPYQDF